MTTETLPLPTTEPFPVDQAAFKQKIVDYLKNNEPVLYNRKKKGRKLETYTELVANEAMLYAQNAISRGMVEQAAWDLAVRQVIMWTKDH